MNEFRMTPKPPLPTVLLLLATPAVVGVPLLLFGPAHAARAGFLFVAGMAAMALGLVRLARQRLMADGTVVRFSPEGVEMEDVYGSLLRVAWPHIERIDVVDSRVPSPRTITGPDGIRVRTGTRRCVGLVGWGEHEVPLEVPGWMVAHLARTEVDRRTGLERLSIPLGTVDPLWEDGPMGDWVRRNRPDLFNRLESPAPRS